MNKYIQVITIGSGVINTLLFNYNMNNTKIIREKKETNILISERFFMSLGSFCIGFIKIPKFIDFIHIKLMKENPKDYGCQLFTPNKIDYYDMFKYI